MKTKSETRTGLIWDLPTRLFHWLLVLLVILQFGTAKYGWLDMQWHFRFGYALLSLLLFRIFWGFAGSNSARFSHFLLAPVNIWRYLRNWRKSSSAAFAGHNPASGLSVVLMLGALLVQALSGLATSDDIEWFGPLHNHLPDAWIAFASSLHRQLEIFILALIALHLSAISAHKVIKHESLTASMVTGRRLLTDVDYPRIASNWTALWLLCLSVALVSAGIAWISQ